MITPLPEWLRDLSDDDVWDQYERVQVLGALHIAWAALNSISRHQTIVSKSMSGWSVTKTIAEQAKTAIHALGNAVGDEPMPCEEVKP